MRSPRFAADSVSEQPGAVRESPSGPVTGSSGEFDPGSERTLAACLRHASRTVRPLRGYTSGARVSNAWVIYRRARGNSGELELKPDETTGSVDPAEKRWPLLASHRPAMSPRPIS